MPPMREVETHPPDTLHLPRSVVAIGAFDGLHLGHVALLSGAVGRARELGVPAVVYTFDPPPRAHFEQAQILMPIAEKLRRLAALGVGHVVVAPFDDAYARRTPAHLIGELQALGAGEVWVGEGFRFGARRSGDIDLLGRSFAVQVHPTVLCSQRRPISSSRVRELLASDAYERASELLGRPVHA
jgi:riboflavin kinase/FMN adenylyltransferase